MSARRRLRRRKVGDLDEIDVSPACRRRYAAALDAFQAWCPQAPVAQPDLWTLVQWDRSVAGFVSHAYNTDASYGLLTDLVSMLGWVYDPLRGRGLGLTWRRLKRWRRLEPPVRVPPFPPDVALAVAWDLLVCTGPCFCLASLLGFHCYLRPTEITAIRRCDVRISATTAVIALGGDLGTKSSKRTGVREYATVDDPWVLQCLRSWCALAQDTQPLCVDGHDPFRDAFRASLEHLDLADQGFGLRSLRRGGATYDFQRHGSFHLSAERGRWRQVETARIYIQDAIPALVRLRMSTVARRLVRHFSLCFARFCM